MSGIDSIDSADRFSQKHVRLYEAIDIQFQSPIVPELMPL